jgi:4-diphosphocytidyl-2C-methyl-D-erythritol kinase
MYNVFEDVLPKNAGAIEEIKQRLLDHGPRPAMTGTGSAVFGIFGDVNAAKEAKRSSADYRECFLRRQPRGSSLYGIMLPAVAGSDF